MENVSAIKEFKSLMESQDWGGELIGLDLSFQWAARPNEGRSTCKQAFEDAGLRFVQYKRHVLSQLPHHHRNTHSKSLT